MQLKPDQAEKDPLGAPTWNRQAGIRAPRPGRNDDPDGATRTSLGIAGAIAPSRHRAIAPSRGTLAAGGDSEYYAPFRFVTINEDRRAHDARRFLATFSFTFPVMMSGGDMRAILHFPGL